MQTVDREKRLERLVDELCEVIEIELIALMEIGQSGGELVATALTAATILAGHTVGVYTTLVCADPNEQEAKISEAMGTLTELATIKAREVCVGEAPPDKPVRLQSLLATMH